MKYIDLHVHSNVSDGTLSPTELVDHAVKLGLSAFALTDHDTIRGIAEAKERAAWHTSQGRAIEVYSGVEISAAYKNKDIHILGLLVNEHDEILDRILTNFLENRNRRNEKMLEKFAEYGIKLTMEDLTADADSAVITRAHFATALMRKGLVSNSTDSAIVDFGSLTLFEYNDNLPVGCLQFSANINPGNSGGPIFAMIDNKVKVIGIVSKADNHAKLGLHWAVPITEVLTMHKNGDKVEEDSVIYRR